MKCQPLFYLLGLPLVLSPLACINHERFCGGINETNMPARVVLVENARGASRYTLKAWDQRLIWARQVLDFAGEPALLNNFPWCCSQNPSLNSSYDDIACIPDDEGPCYPRDEGFTMGYASCAALDGFGVGELQIQEVERFTRRNPPGTMSCELLDVSAVTGDGLMQLSKRGTAFPLLGFPYIGSQIDEAPVLNGVKADAQSDVSISPAHGYFGYVATESPIDEASLYAQDTADGSPPLMISRIWHFSDAPENAVFREYLGIEEEGAFTCGDLYFGYFAR